MEEPFDNFFVICIIINLIVWLAFFIVKYIKSPSITISRTDIVMWAVLAILSSVLSFITTFVFAFIFVIWLLATIVQFFEKHCLDDFVKFFSKDVKIK